MKYLVLAAAAALSPAIVSAGSLDNPWQRPPLIEPPTASLSWGGLYAGLGITTQRSTEYGEDTTYERACLSKNPKSHNGQKCQLSGHDFEYLRDTEQFDVVKNPWSKQVDGPVIYETGGYKGLWMAGQSSVSFTSDADSGAPTSAGKPTSNVLDRVLNEIFVLDQNEELAVNGFAGYRHVTVNGLAGGIEVGTVGGVEGQIGLSQGRWFAYAGYNSAEEVTGGLDVLMGQQGNWFIGGKVASADSTRGEGRIGIKF